MDLATWAKSKYVVEIPIKKSWVTELYDITPHVVSNQQTFVILWVFFCLKGVCYNTLQKAYCSSVVLWL